MTLIDVSDGEPMRAIGVSAVHTGRFRAHADDAIERTRQAAESAASAEELRDVVVQEVAQVLQVRLCKVLELTRDRRLLVVRAGVGFTRSTVGASVPTGSTSMAGLTLAVGGPVVCEDLARAPYLSEATILRRHRVVSGLSVIVGSSEAPTGVLSVHTRTLRGFTVDETRFMRRAAALLAHGLARHRLRSPEIFVAPLRDKPPATERLGADRPSAASDTLRAG